MASLRSGALWSVGHTTGNTISNRSNKASGTTLGYIDAGSGWPERFAAGGSTNGIMVVFVVFDNLTATTPAIASIDKHASETNSWNIVYLDSPVATSGGGVRSAICWIEVSTNWNTSSITYNINFDAAITAKACLTHVLDGVSATQRGTTARSPATGTSGTDSSVTWFPGLQTGDALLTFFGSEGTSSVDPGGSGTQLITADCNTSGGSAATNVYGTESIWNITSPPASIQWNAGFGSGATQDGGILGVGLQVLGSSTPVTSSDTLAIGLTDTSSSSVATAKTGSETTAVSVTESTSILVLNGTKTVTENFADGIPSDITGMSAGVAIDNSLGNPAPSLRSDGSGETWRFNTAKWQASDFIFTYDSYFPSGSNTRDIQNLEFWSNTLGTGGFFFRLQTTLTDGGFSTNLGGVPVVSRDTWYRTTLYANATTGTVSAVTVNLTTSAVHTAKTVTVAGGTRPGYFGQEEDAAGSTEGHRYDNLSLTTGGLDHTALTVTETAQITKFSTRTDTGSIAVTESSTLAMPISASDASAITLTDTSVRDKFLAATDTVAVAVSDTGSVNAGGSPVTTDNAALSVTETHLLAKTGMQSTDQGALVVTETTSSFHTRTATDSAVISVTETGNPVKSLPGQDSAAVSITEARTLASTLSRTETTAITVNDTSALLKTLASTDGAALSVNDTSSFAVGKSATDTASIAVSDTSNKQAVSNPENMGDNIVVIHVDAPVLVSAPGTTSINLTHATASTITVTETYK